MTSRRLLGAVGPSLSGHAFGISVPMLLGVGNAGCAAVSAALK